MVPQTELRVSFQAFGLSSSNAIFARRTSTQSGAVSVLCCCAHLPITICGVHLDPTPDLIAALLAAHSDAVAERLVLCCGAQLPIIICGVHLDPTLTSLQPSSRRKPTPLPSGSRNLVFASEFQY